MLFGYAILKNRLFPGQLMLFSYAILKNRLFPGQHMPFGDAVLKIRLFHGQLMLPTRRPRPAPLSFRAKRRNLRPEISPFRSAPVEMT